MHLDAIGSKCAIIDDVIAVIAMVKIKINQCRVRVGIICMFE